MAGLGVVDDAAALLDRLRAEGFEFQAAGDRLRIRPVDRVTPELRAELARRKAELLALLDPPREYVHLPPLPGIGGLDLPLPVLELAWDLERRQFHVTVDTAGTLHVEPAAALTDRDRAALARWRRHVAALTEYVERMCEAPL